MASQISKQRLAALEKVYAAEIDCALGDRFSAIIQSKAKIYKELEAQGWVQFVEEKIGGFRDGLGPMIIAGWVLTELGRMTYCMSCVEVAADGD